ncbi:MAG: GTP 3',8-cyclase MoaA [Rhodospirillaceae bacterium]|jgi:GTP 3',8-cyclase|nr:GTP 3',8-cyclase MoaA [Rhodospirillaceae bacterium]MBT7647924.1 GTP 3',8-cyclase MoaA [Rhodospirillaceae bacterium]
MQVAMTQLVDPFGRKISYIRLSVTDRCDFRCVYCMSEDMTFLPKKDLLTLEELDRLGSAFVGLGTNKIRISGGEPLVRKGIMQLFRSLGRHLDGAGLQELTLTTNGSQLSRFTDELWDCGVRRINVSIDTLDRDRFKEITRWGYYDKVMDGIEAARKKGFQIKLNAVAMKGVNEVDFDPMIQWCGDQGFDLTFIETMPLGEIDGDRTEQYLPLSVLRADLKDRWTLEDIDYKTGGPARYMRVKETGGRLGFITPMTHNFCESCNRIRLTCTGMLYMCLGQEDNADLKAPLRASEGDEQLVAAIHEAIGRKPKGHDFVIDRRSNKPAVSRHMSVTGG